MNFSVVITTYNRLNLLRRAIESASNQTLPCEVVVVDDCSTDKTESYCRGLGDKIVYIRNPVNLGHSFSVNIGVLSATGNWIKLLDDDDYLVPNCNEEISKALAGRPKAVICSCQAIQIDARGREIRLTRTIGCSSAVYAKQEDIHYAMAMEMLPFGTASQVAFNKSAFLKTKGWNKSLKGPFDEIYYWVEAAEQGDALFVNQPLVYKVMWEGSGTFRHSIQKHLERNICIKEKIHSVISEKHKKKLPSAKTIQNYLKLHWGIVALKRLKVLAFFRIVFSAILSPAAWKIFLKIQREKKYRKLDIFHRVSLDKLKVSILADYLPDGSQSMLHFANIIEQGLKDKGHRVHVIRPEPIFGLIKQTGTGLGKWLGYVDKFIIFPKLLRKATRCTDIIHILDHSNAVYVKYLDGMPHIATCEDLLAIRSALGEFKENITKWSGRKLQKMILAGLNQTQHVVCISESTRKDLLRVSKLNPESVSRIYMGLNYNYSPMGESEAKLHLERLGINFSNPFLLNVSKNNWYKNRHGLLDIFRFLDEHTNKKQFNLIIAGSPLSLRLRKLVRRYGLREKIHEVIFPENEDLRALYSMAKALIYPSIAEGFGWPIIEAQACGCPVFTTGRPPMTEAGGGAAVYFDPNKPQEAAQIIAETLSDNAKVAKMKEEGLENVKRFSVERMIEEYIKVYRTAIEENQGKNNP